MIRSAEVSIVTVHVELQLDGLNLEDYYIYGILNLKNNG